MTTPNDSDASRYARQDGVTMGAKVKVPTVREALRFTPFTSIVPFDPSIVAAPTCSAVNSRNIIAADANALTSSRNVLNQLSAGASRAEDASERCQKTLDDVKRLLQTSTSSHFNFRKPPSRQIDHSDKPRLERPQLSDFAKMVWDAVPFEIRYPAADGDLHSQPQTTAIPLPLVAQPTNGHVLNRDVQKSAPQLTTPTIQPEAIKVSQRITLAEQAMQTDGRPNPAPQNESGTARNNINHAHTEIHIDPKAKGEASVSRLSSLLDAIFTAEDSLISGDDLSDEILSIFRFQDTENVSSHILSAAYQERLEKAVQKVALAGRLGSIPTERLKRVQKLCNEIVQVSVNTSLRVSEDWSDAEVEEWQQHLASAEGSLLAIRILLKIMTAGSSGRELYSEDLVRSLLEVMRNIAETGIVSVVETHGDKKTATDNASSNTRFAIAQDNHDLLLVVLRGFTKALQALGTLLAKVNIDEVAISSTVYMCRILLFAENASTDRESIYGVQTYEGTRRHAMDVLARVFDRYAEHRQFIFDEILLSLEKLPATKQSARQFRLPDCKPIQLVSALIMQLIQTSATRGGTKLSTSQTKEDDSSSADEDDQDESEDDLTKVGTPSKKNVSKDLFSLINPLEMAAQSNAIYVTKTLVQRALHTTKNADEPHRKLLDIFTEDFLSVLALPEWPSAELLLQSLLRQMLGIVESSKSTVPARNFALESMGRMGSGILEVQRQAQDYANSNALADSGVMLQLAGVLRQEKATDELLDLLGPYRVIVEFLHSKQRDSAQIPTAIGYHLLQWSRQVVSTRQPSLESDSGDNSISSSNMQSKLRVMLTDPQWFDTNAAFDTISQSEVRIATLVITTNSPFCKAFNTIFRTLLAHMSSEHATVKSRSIRSIVDLIELHPTVLDRNSYILPSILHRVEDKSAMVRDAALGLISTCVADRPQLEIKVFEHIIRRLDDSGIGVRKHAMSLLKDIYMRNESAAIRTAVPAAIIHKIKDPEESVVEIAKSTIEQIWFLPLYNADMSNATIRVKHRSQASLLVQVVESDDRMPDTLASVLRNLLDKSKNAKNNAAVARHMIECLSEGILDSAGFTETITQGMLLQTLAVFAQACPRLFTASQLELLEPYTRNLLSNEDLTMFRLALTTLRHTMPYITGLRKDFLVNLQKSLLSTLGKLPPSEFPEVAVCLWAIDGELKNTDMLVRVVSSAVNQVRMLASKNSSDSAIANKLIRLLSLVGQLGKACDLEAYYGQVKGTIPNAKSDTVAGIIVESSALYAVVKSPLPIRQAAFQSICAVSQRWPKQFLRLDVGTLFDALLAEQVPVLEDVFLVGLLGFFSEQEASASVAEDPEAGATGRERLARTYVATDQDGAAASLSQRYLQHILRLATGSIGETALTATKLVASIVRQGLPHPKECGPSLIALETSPNNAIAELACAEHRTLHDKHEAIIEKEYLRAMQRALLYQETVVSDAKGWTGAPPGPKLYFFWDVLRSGKAKARQKFLTNQCLKLSFDPLKLDVRPDQAPHLVFVRFMVENLALFEYDRTDDLKLVIDNLHKAFATTGTPLAQTIDSEVFNLTIASIESNQPTTGMDGLRIQDTDKNRLRTLAVSAQILLLIAEARAFILRIWGGQKLLKVSKGVKETSKVPTRSTNSATLAEAFVKRTEQLALPCLAEDNQRAMCRNFAEVLSTDNEAKVGSDDDEDDGDDDASLSRDNRSPSVALLGTPSGRKRKSLSAGVTGPRKRGRPRKTPSFIRGEDEDAEGEWE